MEGIIPKLHPSAKKRLLNVARSCQKAELKTRYLIILNLYDGITPTETARRLKVARSSVYRIAQRFREVGEAGLVDRREENEDRKLDEQTWDPTGRSLTGHRAGPATAFPAAVLSRSQPYRADMARSARRRHSQPHLRRHERPDEKRPALSETTQHRHPAHNHRSLRRLSQNQARLFSTDVEYAGCRLSNSDGVAGGPCRTLEAERGEDECELVYPGGCQFLQVKVFEEVDAVFGDHPLMHLNRAVAVRGRINFDAPVVGSDNRHVLFDEPLRSFESNPRLARVVRLVVLDP